jgi:hypothetical protein
MTDTLPLHADSTPASEPTSPTPTEIALDEIAVLLSGLGNRVTDLFNRVEKLERFL